MTSRPDRNETVARLACLAVLAVTALGLSFGTDARAQGPNEASTGMAAPRPPSISVVDAKTGEIVERVDVTGTLTPRQTVSVGADVDGLRVVSLAADEGDRVEKGQVLATLETDFVDTNIALNAAQIERAKASIAQAQAQIADAEAAAKQAQAALDRSRPLVQKGIIGQNEMDQRVAAADSAAARLNSARQGLAVSRADLAAQEAQRDQWLLKKAKTVIRAPTAGLILSRTATLGAIVSSASGSLFEIARDGLIELDAKVSETMLGRLSEGQTVAVYVAGRTKPVEGDVRLIAPQVDQTTRLGTVKIALPKNAEGLRAGNFARGVVEVARSTGVLVPRSAVVFEGDDAAVQVVKDGVVERRVVDLGLTTADQVEIVKGVAQGESVVAVAGAFVRNGDTVTPVQIAASKVSR
ncbi:efflux RND transporter periplasmic adaptor subunit [Jiella sp. MQZ9-1]|nr:efflux RND transporter periplasmic adaptor subunit [Jiella flava]MCD2470103.1 efflux RND transporter periplasmic adaptor subunit [Jiella flava]